MGAKLLLENGRLNKPTMAVCFVHTGNPELACSGVWAESCTAITDPQDGAIYGTPTTAAMACECFSLGVCLMAGLRGVGTCRLISSRKVCTAVWQALTSWRLPFC